MILAKHELTDSRNGERLGPHLEFDEELLDSFYVICVHCLIHKRFKFLFNCVLIERFVFNYLLRSVCAQ